MDKLMSALLVIAAPFAVYLVGAFIMWDLNAGNWDIGARFFVGVFGVFGAAGFITTAVDQYKEDSK